ncbi:hypothetical protein QYM36_015962 [Artemia franciscana]|uniref:Uncharacterized protein n=1 Tax=Artemia franciscana TaxID=6661 RepID=A0AA88HE43_ARTSF|nr:hypothetical protein QYM36_015962 [Artemia franciscana]
MCGGHSGNVLHIRKCQKMKVKDKLQVFSTVSEEARLVDCPIWCADGRKYRLHQFKPGSSLELWPLHTSVPRL